MKQENIILLAGELLDLHNDGKIDLTTWANARELVEWFLIMKVEDN
jgi:hypothetical protein